MILPTHLVGSQLSFYTVCVFFAYVPTGSEAIVAACASMLPDLDHPKSILGSIFSGVSNFIHIHFGHRSATHSLVTIAAFSALFFWFLPYGYALALTVGWISHPLLDRYTSSGLFIFWPLSRDRWVAWKNPHYRVDVMSGGELAWNYSMFLICIPMFFAMQTGLGAKGIIQQELGDIASAVMQFQREKGNHRWYLNIEGRSNQTQADIGGRYFIIEAKAEGAFYIQHNLETVTVSSTTSTDWYATLATLQRGEPEKTTVISANIGSIEAGIFQKLVNDAVGNNTVFYTGTLTTESGIGTSQNHNLEYVTVSSLPSGPWYHGVNLTIQVRHSPDLEIPKIDFPTESATPRDDPILDELMGQALDSLGTTTTGW